MGCGCSDKQSQAAQALPDSAMSVAYWNARYKQGVGPGGGSRGRQGAFKLMTVQKFVDELKCESIIDVGCGDGSQLRKLEVGSYRGMDIAEAAIDLAIADAPKNAPDWMYHVMDPGAEAEEEIADLSISMNVLGHLPAPDMIKHLKLVFGLSRRYVLIYGPNHDGKGLRLADHMHFHKFVPVVKELFGLDPVEHVSNPYPAAQVKGQIRPDTSFCDFYLFDKKPKTKRRAKDEQEDQG